MKNTKTLLAVLLSAIILIRCQTYRPSNALIYNKSASRPDQKGSREISFVFKSKKESILSPTIESSDREGNSFKIFSILDEKNTLHAVGTPLPPGLYRIKASSSDKLSELKSGLIFLIKVNDKTIEIRPTVSTSMNPK